VHNHAFYIDTISDEKTSYADLLRRINATTLFLPTKRTKNNLEVFEHILVGLLLGVDFVLIDPDFSFTDLQVILKSDEVNEKEVQCDFSFSSFEQILSEIMLSESKIKIFTSGTTGLPKIIDQNMQTFRLSMRVGERYKDDVWAFAYNSTHMAGLQVFFQAIFNHNTIVNIFGAPRLISIGAINKYLVTHISATPTFFRILLPLSPPNNSIKKITLGGEKSNEVLLKQISTSFPSSKINNIYATTEFGALLFSEGDVFHVPEKLADYIRIGDDGSLLVHTTLVSSKNAKDEKNLIGEWYKTGDSVEILSNNPLSFIFAGRLSELVNIGGNKVNPKEIEEVLNKHELVGISRIFTRENSVLGHVLTAEVVLKPGVTISEKELKAYLASKLAGYKVPRMIKFTDQISLTRTGKIASK
jgi:acyl-coenzyme A synthetase/AMP-(fatty) acid ligase